MECYWEKGDTARQIDFIVNHVFKREKTNSEKNIVLFRYVRTFFFFLRLLMCQKNLKGLQAAF